MKNNKVRITEPSTWVELFTLPQSITGIHNSNFNPLYFASLSSRSLSDESVHHVLMHSAPIDVVKAEADQAEADQGEDGADGGKKEGEQEGQR